MKRLILSTTLVVAGLCAVAAFAQDVTAPNGAFVIRRIERRLGVTQEQREQARAVLAAERPTILELHRQAEAERAEMNAQPFSEAQVRAVAAKYDQTNTAILVEHAKVRSEILAILTPAQREMLERFRADFDEGLNHRLETLGDQL